VRDREGKVRVARRGRGREMIVAPIQVDATQCLLDVAHARK